MATGHRYMFCALLALWHIHGATSGAPPVPPPKKCGMYGQAPCAFVPAAPGTTPKCASPGKTFCEHNADYPSYLIQHLVETLGYQRILTNEERLDFNANLLEEEHLHHHYHHFYGTGYGPPMDSQPAKGPGYPNRRPASYQQPANTVAYDRKPPQQPVPQPIYIPKPQHSFNYNTYVKGPTPKVPPGPMAMAGGGYFYTPPSSTQYSPSEWLQRFARDLVYRHVSRTANAVPAAVQEDWQPKPFRPSTLLNETSYRGRHKRQTPTRESLCDTRTMYVSPQVALNTKGNWMYVVNHEQSRQLVKTELCESTECSNLCSLPLGYNSRCEQKYVQKRLITLDAGGQTLYTDTYWFPSCCVCTLASTGPGT